MNNTQRLIKCNKCGHIAPASDFPKGQDFFQREFISSCPKECGNQQNPGDASMRMFGGERPFVFVQNTPEPEDAVGKVLHRAKEVS